MTDREPRRVGSPEMDARLWHPWLRINRVRRVMLHTRWSAPDRDPREPVSMTAHLDLGLTSVL